MLKRSTDILFAAVALVLLAPLLLPVMLILRLTGEGEVFYLQERVGKGGKSFDIVKFATMLKESPSMSGGDITVVNDPRVLPVGKVLRKTKLNELPQVWNVLVGDMSLIGPRPQTRRVYDLFPESYKEAVSNVRPGLSGVGSIVFRDEEKLLSASSDRERAYTEVIVPYKAALEVWYVRNQSFWLDIKLVIFTIFAVVRPQVELSDYLEGMPPRPMAKTA